MEGPKIFVLSGAGLSAESGMGTFRDKGGIWAQFSVDEYATPEAFAKNPKKVLDFYNARRANLLKAEVNSAHIALAQLQTRVLAMGGQVTLCTQNIDDLLERSGAVEVLHMHGDLLSELCMACGAIVAQREETAVGAVCRGCGEAGGVRPNVVWFGEMPYFMETIATRLAAADIFVSIGTSGMVYPAAAFVQWAREAGAYTVELTLEPSENASVFHHGRYGPATEIVPQWVMEAILECEGAD